MDLFKKWLSDRDIKVTEAKASDYVKFALKTKEEYKGIEIDSLDAEQSANLYSEYASFMQKTQNELIESKASKADLEEIKDLLLKEQERQVANLTDTIRKQAQMFTEASKQDLPDIPVARDMAASIVATLKTNFTDQLEAYKTQGTPFKMEKITTKVAGTMSTANISGGDVPQAQRLEGFDTVPSRRIRMIDVVQNRSTTSPKVEWVYQSNKDGTAGQTAEGTAKNQIDFDIVVGSQEAVKTTAYIKVTTEMLNDIVWLEQEIRAELTREILKVVEAQLYEGDGTGLNHNGIRTVASAFAAGSFAASVDNANILDVLTVAMTNIAVAMEGEAVPNYVFVHPNTVAALKLYKVSATDRRYVDRLVNAGANLQFDGVTIIPTTLVTDGEYLIGDFGMAELYTHETMDIMMGLDGNDFTLNLRTIIAEWRGMTVVRNQRRPSFVAGVFATDAAALETA